jgi:hypothetical protein
MFSKNSAYAVVNELVTMVETPLVEHSEPLSKSFFLGTSEPLLGLTYFRSQLSAILTAQDC